MEALQIRSPTDELSPGETARIPIFLVLDRAIRVRGIHATFHGAEETKATYTSYNAATKTTETHTAVEHVDIVTSGYLLSGRERKGFIGNIADGFSTLLGGGAHDVLEPGEYPFEVDIQIPPDGRASFHGKNCRVFYELSVLVDIPMGWDLKAVKSFNVTGAPGVMLPSPEAVRIRFPEDQQRGLLDSWFSPDVRVEAALTRNVFCDGDTVEGIFVVETPKPLQYRAINVRVISVETTTAQGYSGEHTHFGEPVRIAADGVIEDTYSQQFSLPVSCPGPPTTRGSLFSVGCFVQIELDVSWAKDPKIRIPIFVS